MALPFASGRLAALALVALAPSSMASAEDFHAGGLTIQQPWARATPNGAQVAGGYVTVTNHGTTADTLTGGSFDAATTFTIHDMTTTDGVMAMRPAGPVTIPPGASVTLSPASTHIMFTGLKHGLKKGETIGGTLVFAQAGTVPVRFAVAAIGARAPSAHGSDAMPGMTMQ